MFVRNEFLFFREKGMMCIFGLRLTLHYMIFRIHLPFWADALLFEVANGQF